VEKGEKKMKTRELRPHEPVRTILWVNGDNFDARWFENVSNPGQQIKEGDSVQTTAEFEATLKRKHSGVVSKVELYNPNHEIDHENESIKFHNAINMNAERDMREDDRKKAEEMERIRVKHGLPERNF
jgi:hypothetical protein